MLTMKGTKKMKINLKISLIVFLIVVVGYGLYCFARRFFPSFTKVLMGAR